MFVSNQFSWAIRYTLASINETISLKYKDKSHIKSRNYKRPANPITVYYIDYRGVNCGGGGPFLNSFIETNLFGIVIEKQKNYPPPWF